MDASFQQWVKALTSRWFTAMSGPLAVPLGIAAVYVSDATLKVIFGLTALGGLIFAAYWPWREERQARIASDHDAHGFGETRELVSDDEIYEATDWDGMLVVRRNAHSKFTIKLPANPSSGKIIDVAKASDDKSEWVAVDGNGHNVVGGPAYVLSFDGQSITVRFSGVEWIIL